MDKLYATFDFYPKPGVPNLNGRIYAEGAIEDALKKYLADDQKRFISAGYTDDQDIPLDHIVAEVKKINFGEKIQVEIELLDTTKGRNFSQLLKEVPKITEQYAIAWAAYGQLTGELVINPVVGYLALLPKSELR